MMRRNRYKPAPSRDMTTTAMKCAVLGRWQSLASVKKKCASVKRKPMQSDGFWRKGRWWTNTEWRKYKDACREYQAAIDKRNQDYADIRNDQRIVQSDIPSQKTIQ
jgi:hypothetical protein